MFSVGQLGHTVEHNRLAGLVFDVTAPNFGAIGDGSTDDTAAIQAALDAAVDGGTVLFPAGKTYLTGNLTLRFTAGAVQNISAHGARIVHTGSGSLCSIPGLGWSQQMRGATFLGGEWVGNPSSDACWSVVDTGGLLFSDLQVSGFDAAGASAWAVSNVDSFCENLKFTNIEIHGCSRVATYEGVATDRSFARQRWVNVMVHGWFGDDYLWYFGDDANLYGSVFIACSGNAHSDLDAVFRINDNMGSASFISCDWEGGRSSPGVTYLFEKSIGDPGANQYWSAGSWPSIVGCVVRDEMVMTNEEAVEQTANGWGTGALIVTPRFHLGDVRTRTLRVASSVGFYGAEPIARQTGVPVSAAGIHAALVSLGLITA